MAWQALPSPLQGTCVSGCHLPVAPAKPSHKGPGFDAPVAKGLSLSLGFWVMFGHTLRFFDVFMWCFFSDRSREWRLTMQPCSNPSWQWTSLFKPIYVTCINDFPFLMRVLPMLAYLWVSFSASTTKCLLLKNMESCQLRLTEDFSFHTKAVTTYFSPTLPINKRTYHSKPINRP